MGDIAPKDGVQIDAKGNRYRAAAGEEMLPGAIFVDPKQDNEQEQASVRAKQKADRDATAAAKKAKGASEDMTGKGARETA